MTKPTQHFPDLLEGDIVCVGPDPQPSLFQRLIVRVQERKNNAPAKSVHVDVAVSRESIVGAVGRIRKTVITDYANRPVIIYRHRDWTMAQRAAIGDLAVSVVGQMYGWGKLGLIWLESWLPKSWYPFTRHLGVTSFKVCSNLVGWLTEKAIDQRPWNGVHWRCLNPDFIDDESRDHPLTWKVVHNTMYPELTASYQALT